jgi:hypothetical protein
LIATLKPVIADKWGLSFYAGGGNTSESALFVAGSEIKEVGKPTHVYVLSDYDPSGEIIANQIAKGTKNCPGGLSRFTGDVPVYVHQLGLTREQVKCWKIPTRPVRKEKDKKNTLADRFIEKHGDGAVELDAIPPNTLRDLIDKTISKHRDYREIEALKAIEQEEWEQLAEWMRRRRGW